MNLEQLQPDTNFITEVACFISSPENFHRIQRLKTTSGHWLKIQVYPDLIWVYDEFRRYYNFMATYNDDYAEFDIRTRHFASPERHPDLNAAELFTLSLKLFQNHQPEMRGICAAWTDDCDFSGELISDNFKSMRDLIKPDGILNTPAIVQAALATWTGKQAVRHGYSHIPNNGIFWVNHDGQQILKVRFEKPPLPSLT